MAYHVVVSPAATKQIKSLPPEIAARITRSLRALESNPRPPGSLKLTASNEYRIRVGEYRIVYQIDDAAQTVDITKVGHRRDVYRP